MNYDLHVCLSSPQLNDIEMGGGIAFIRAGIAVQPIKHSAVYWVTRLGGGAQDEDLRHFGCPPVMGRKVVASKWIRYTENFLSHPCPLVQGQRYKFKIHGREQA